MNARTARAGLAGLMLLPVLTACGGDDEPDAAACTDLTILGARGSGEDAEGTDPEGFGGLGGAAAHLITEVVGEAPREWTTSYRGVDYPAVGVGPAQADPDLFTASVTEGVDDALEQASTVLDACPDTRLMFLGYSQGAIVAHGVIAGVSSEHADARQARIAERVWAVLMLADPVRDPSDADVEYLDLGGDATRPGVLPEIRLDVSPGARGRVASLCGVDDNVCNTPAGQTWQTFTISHAHLDAYTTPEARDAVVAWLAGLDDVR